MKKIPIFIFVLIGLLFFADCGSEDNPTPTCTGETGTEKELWSSKKNAAHFPWQEANWNPYTEGTYRVFQVWFEAKDNVCPAEHIKVYVRCLLTKAQPRNIQVRVKHRYGPFGVYGGTFIPSTIIEVYKEYIGHSDFGIANAYGSEPGSFYMMIEWVIDNYQDYEIDLAYFQSVFIYAELEYEWKFFN